MKSYAHYLPVCTPECDDITHITPHVQEALTSSNLKEGLCLEKAMHITSSVFIKDNQPSLQ